MIANQFCETCAENEELPVPATIELDSWGDGSGGGGFLCDNCHQNRGEAADEARLSDYWGGSGPYTVEEQYAAAARQRRELRSKG